MKKTIAAVLAALVLAVLAVLPLTASAKPVALEDGEYNIAYDIKGTGTMKLVEPATLIVDKGKTYARLAFNDPEVDKLYLGDDTLLPAGFTKSRNIMGKLPVFRLPLEKLDSTVDFKVHTRGVNLEVDRYSLTMADYDENYDGTAKAEQVVKDISGAQPVKFYKWSTGMSSSIWGPFAFLAAVALAIFGWSKAHQRDE